MPYHLTTLKGDQIMAKSKVDYIAQGLADQQAGRNRNVTFKKGSWQENAYDDGFNQGIRAAAVRAEAEKQADIAMREDRPAEYFGDAGATQAAHGDKSGAHMAARMEHIRILRKDAASEQDARRKARLLAKANVIAGRLSVDIDRVTARV